MYLRHSVLTSKKIFPIQTRRGVLLTGTALRTNCTEYRKIRTRNCFVSHMPLLFIRMLTSTKREADVRKGWCISQFALLAAFGISVKEDFTAGQGGVWQTVLRLKNGGANHTKG